MDFREYQALARRTQNNEISLHARKMHALHGMSSEVGEIHGIFQKYYQGHPVNYSELIKEIGDLMWFISELCDVIDVDLESVCACNIAKLRERYPEGFDEERSRSRYPETSLDDIKDIISRMEDDVK